jgi:hypothetical protein
MALIKISSVKARFGLHFFDCAPWEDNYLQPTAVGRTALARQTNFLDITLEIAPL